VPYVDLAGRVVTIDPPVEIEVRGDDDKTSAP
jgi:hypothetical protein